MIVSSRSKPAIIWVDHEASIHEMLLSIGELVRTKSNMKKVDEYFEMTGVLVDPSPRETLAARAKATIEENCPTCDLVLVDLSFDPNDPPEAIDVGRKLALDLREELKGVPVGVYTRYDLQPRYRVQLSTDGFAVILEEIPKLYAKERRIFGGDDWCGLFTRIIDELNEKSSSPLYSISPFKKTNNVHWASGQPQHRSRSFTEAAPVIVGQALKDVSPPPPETTLTQLGGGFSGSYIVKAEFPDRHKAFVVKIDESPERLEKELKGYRIVEGRVSHDHYLPIATHSNWPVKLYDDWWGAFAMSYEGKATPLLEHANLSSDILETVYHKLWEECLHDLYGETSTEKIEETTVLSPEVIESALKGSHGIERYVQRLSFLEDQAYSAITTASEFIRGTNRQKISENTVLYVPWSTQIHGDLNCRNILYDDKTDNFKIIDFPNVGPNSVAVDFVRAEAELVLIMLDWDTGYDLDILQLSTWDSLISVLSAKFEIPQQLGQNTAIDHILPSIKIIRESFLTTANGNGDLQKTYWLFLLARVLRYVGYSDVTTAKRFLALMWVGRLLENKW